MRNNLSDNAPATGCVHAINTLITNDELWESVIETLWPQFRHSQNTDQMVYKDLYVTEALRCSVVPSDACPQALVVFKGGTSLVKAHKIINRFSEDVDVNIIPPPPEDQAFGSARRKNVLRELQTRLNAGIPLPMTHNRHGDRFASTRITYPSIMSDSPIMAGGPTYGDVIVEMNIRDQPPNTTTVQTVTSLVGEAAAVIDPELLTEYPPLQPFEVLTADPIIAVVDKLDALHWRSLSDTSEDVGLRARDIYDLACLLRHGSVLSTLNSDRVAEMHEDVVASLPTGLANRSSARPTDGFAASPAFRAGHPACDALKAKYHEIRQYVYSDENWIEFDDALAVIHNSGDLI